MRCEVGPIHEIHRRLVEEGYHITEYTLRRWIKSGQLPAVYSGKKALISYAKVMSIITAA